MSPATRRPALVCGASGLVAVGLLVLAPAVPGAPNSAARAGGRELVTTSSVPVPDGWRVQRALAGDVDGDGLRDMAVACSERGRPFERSVRIHLRRRSGAAFPIDPDFEVDLTPDVVAFAIGDVHADPGAELVLFTARACFAWRPRGAEEQRFVKLVESDFLWQLPDPHDVPSFESGLADLDGDGLEDLVMPGLDGYRIALQRRAEGAASFDLQSELVVPADRDLGGGYVTTSGGEPRWRGRRDSGMATLSITVGSESASSYVELEPLLDISDQVPAPQLIDWNADGRLDILAQTTRLLHVWLLGEGDVYGQRPDRSLELPVVADRDRRFDASYSSQTLDLEGDGRADCVILAGDQRSDDVRTQTLVFRQGAERGGADAPPLFGEGGVPVQVLVLAGFVGEARFEDVNGDGRPDLSLRVVRPDLIDQLRTVSTQRIGAQVIVYFNRGGRFSKRPDIDHRISFTTEVYELESRFFADVSGDGRRDLLLRDEGERIHVLMTRAAGDDWSLVDRPLWEMRIRGNASLAFPEDSRARHFIVLERTQAILVEFDG